MSDTCQVLAVVKADAYGHGAVVITKALRRMGVTRFGVATMEEGLALREAGVRAPILVMGPVFPYQTDEVLANNLTPVVYDAGIAEKLTKAAQGRKEPFAVHIKVDTGMNRLGFMPEQVLPLLRSSAFKGPLRVEGLMTHLADADNQDEGYTRNQLAGFRAVVSQVEAAGFPLPLIHAANSAGILRYPGSHFTAVRPGLMLYGYHTLAGGAVGAELKPLLSLTTTVAQVRPLSAGGSVSYNCTYVATRPSRIAVLPVGYADGYGRLLSNRGKVLIKGHLAPIIGRVCMDLTMLDVTDIPDVKAGDEAVLLGSQHGVTISAADLASWQETIPYEVLCAVGPRVMRVYRAAQATSRGRKK